MDRCSYFIKDKALFGSCPSQEVVDHLENIGVRYFIDLTSPEDKRIEKYETKYTKLNFPIKDRSIPEDPKKFCAFVIKVCYIIRNLNAEMVYVHCKGGHGRSGVLVASVLCHYLKISPEEALQKTRAAHQERKEMREKWRILGSPQTFSQKEFVRALFKPIFYHPHQYTCFNTLNADPIEIEGMGIFPTVEAAYQAFKNPTDESYINALKKAENDPKLLGKQVNLRNDKNWDNIRLYVMYLILRLKFQNNLLHKDVLMSTILRPIIRVSKKTSFWHLMKNNTFGRVLEKVRNEFFLEDFF